MLGEIGEDGQLRLGAASVLVIGLGGLGAPVATYLTGAGIGRIGLCDMDVVSLTNLQRQVLYTEADLGKPKAECAACRLAALNSEVEFTLHPEGISESNCRELVMEYHLVIDCTDNFATRFLIDDVCAELHKPWIHGTIGEFYGQVSVFGNKLGRRYSELFPDREELEALPRRVAGVLGAVPGVVGAIQASEAIKLIAGFGTLCEGKLFTINLLTLKTSLVEF